MATPIAKLNVTEWNQTPGYPSSATVPRVRYHATAPSLKIIAAGIFGISCFSMLSAYLHSVFIQIISAFVFVFGSKTLFGSPL